MLNILNYFNFIKICFYILYFKEIFLFSSKYLTKSLPLMQTQCSRIAKIPSLSKIKTKQITIQEIQKTGNGYKNKCTHLDNLATKCSSSELCWLVQLHGTSYTGAEKEVRPHEMP